MKIFEPEILHTMRRYSKSQLYSDLMAGVIVGIVALPLAIAFGIASGVTPEKGLFTAIIAGFIISLLGGSRVQIGGPTGAFIVIVYGIVQQYGITGLAIATIIAGVMLVGMGLLKLGMVIKFIPYPVVVGFTSGIALTIFATQIKDLLGLQMDSVPADFVHKWSAYAAHISSLNHWSAIVGGLSILIIALMPKVLKKIPGSLVAILLMTVLVYVLRHTFGIEGIETIGDRFTINASLPHATTYAIDFDTVRKLLPVAFSIAMLGAIESLLSATVADGVVGSRHNSNTELIAQGVANIVTPLFGGIPATGAIARTMTNINNGGRTPVAGIVHAVVLLLIMLFLGDLTKHIPMPCLAGVLVVVAYNMSEWRTFRALLRNTRSDALVLITTFLLTVVFDLTIAIEVGLLLAVVLFLRRLFAVSNVSVFDSTVSRATYAEHGEETDLLQLPHGVLVYEVEGPFFFGVANKFEETLRQVGGATGVRIIRMRKVPFMDATGANNLKNVIRMAHNEGTKILLSGVNPAVKQTLETSGVAQMIGTEAICANINEAIGKAETLLSNTNGLIANTGDAERD